MCPLSAHRRITALTHLIIMATKEYFPGIGKIKFEGKESKNPMAFRYYDAEKVIMGKKMKDWLKFSMAWWHTLCAEGGDQFGGGTKHFPWNGDADKLQAAKNKMDTGSRVHAENGHRILPASTMLTSATRPIQSKSTKQT